MNSTPTDTARAELHSNITFHHANTRGSAQRLRIFVSLKQLSSTRHVSSHAAPDIDHKQEFSLTHFIHFSNPSDGLIFAHKPCDSRPSYTLRCSTAEWRINTNPSSHKNCSTIRLKTCLETHIKPMVCSTNKFYPETLKPALPPTVLPAAWEQQHTDEPSLENLECRLSHHRQRRMAANCSKVRCWTLS